MKNIFRTFAALAILSAAMHAQLVTVHSKIGLGSGGPNAGKNYLHFEAVNCGQNFPIQIDPVTGGVMTVVSRTFDIVANNQGVAQGTVVPNDQITCGNVASTQWRVSVLTAQGIAVAPPKKFFICSAAAAPTQQCAQVAGKGGTFDVANAQIAIADPPAPGWIGIMANPLTDQVWRQPTGTTASFYGTFDFTNANLIGISGGGGGGGITSVTGTAPLSFTAGSAPVGSITKADSTHDGYISSTDWNTFNSKGSGTVQSVTVSMPSPGFSASGCTITSTGTCTITYNGQIPVSSLGTGTPNSTNVLFGSGAWAPALTYSSTPITSLVAGTNITLVPSGSALTINSTSAVTFPIAAPESATPQYSISGHAEIGIASALVGSQLPIRQVQVTAATGPDNIILTLSSPINVLRWAVGDTFQITNLPSSNSLNTLNSTNFTVTAVGQSTPTGTVTFSTTTSISTGTYAVTQGSASNWAGSLAGHTWRVNRVQSTTTNPSRTGSIEFARRDAVKGRTGAVDDSGIDIAELRLGAQQSPTNGVGAGVMTASGTNSSGASSITVAKGAGADWTAKAGDYILIDQANGDSDLQMYKVSSDTTVTQGTTTSLPITPNLRTNITSGVLIVASWSYTQLGDATGVEIPGMFIYTPDSTAWPDGCVTIASGLWSSTGTSCGGSASAAGSDKDIQFTTGSGVFAVDTGVFTYDSSTNILKVGTMQIQGKSTVANEGKFTIGAVSCSPTAAGESAWCFDTDGFFKISESGGAFYRPGTGAGTGNVSNQGTPTNGQFAQWTDATHIQGVSTTGSGNVTLATGPTLAGPLVDLIKDTNGASAIAIGATASAVDYLTVTNSATANPATVTVTATGSDSNININFVSKGSGTIQCNGTTCGSGGTSYTNLFQTDANTLTQRNSGVTQVYQVMDSYTDSSNYQGLVIGGNYIKTLRAGTGNNRQFIFGVDNGTLRGWQVATSIDLVPYQQASPANIGIASNRVGGFYGASIDLTGAMTVTMANEGVTGTAVNKLAKLTGAPSTLVLPSTSDTNGFVGIVVSGAGTTSNATVARQGTASCVFDAGTTAGDWVQASTTVAGDCHDVGSTYPTAGQVLGRVLSTNVGAGTYAMLVHSGTVAATGGGGGSVTQVQNPTGGSPLFSAVTNNQTTTPQIVFTMSSVAANTIYANNTGSSAVPSFVQPLLTGSLFANQGTPTTVLIGNNAGNLAFGSVNLSTMVTGIAAPVNLGTGTPDATKFLRGDGSWQVPSGGGNVSTNGTITVGYAAEWATSTAIRAIQTSGSGLYLKQTSPTIITPLMASIKDTAGNPALELLATASAVNDITLTNAAAGNGPAIGVQGTDANIDINLVPKGAGKVKVTGPVQASGVTGYYQGPEGPDPSVCASGFDAIYASSTNHYLTMCNNGGAQQKIIGSGADINTSDQVVGAHFPFTRAGDIWYYNGSTWTNFAGNNSGTKYMQEDSSGNLSWGSGTSTVAWSSLLDSTATVTLNMAAFSSSFLYTGNGSSAFLWGSSTPATSGANFNSPVLTLYGTYWTGAASANDQWFIQEGVASGSNPASTLSFTHQGSSGLSLVQVPGLLTTGTTALSAAEGTAPSGVAGRDILFADSTAHIFKQILNNGTAIPVVGGPSGGSTTGDVACFSGTTGGLLSDCGFLGSNVVTAAANFTSGNLPAAAGNNKALVDSGVVAAQVLFSASAFSGSGNLVQSAGANRSTSDSGLAVANVNFSTANITTGDIVIGANNGRQLADGNILASALLTTASKADTLQAANSCADAGSTDTYACNLSPAITAYAARTQYCFVANTANTGASSINFNGKGALAIKRVSRSGSITADTATGDILAGQVVCGYYDGTNFQMSSQVATVITGLPAGSANGDLAVYNGSAWVKVAGNSSGTKYASEDASGNFAWAAASSSVAIDGLLGATGTNTINNGDFTQTWQWLLTTSSGKGLRISEPSASSAAGTPYLFAIDTAASSTVNPLIVTAVGTSNGIRVLKSGFLTTAGTGGIDSNMLFCDVTTATKCMQFTLSGITAANTRAVTIPDAASTTVVADTGASNNFLTAISATGAISKAQPSISSLSDGANIVTAASPAGAQYQVPYSSGATRGLSYSTLDNTATHAYFATATGPQFRAIAAGDLPGTLSSGTAITNAVLTTPSIGAATGTSLYATGIIDGKATVNISTTTPCTLGTASSNCSAVNSLSGYTFNEHATAATAITYNLPTAAAGLQYCVANAYNGSAANTGVLTVATSASGQFIIFTDGTLSATGGNVTSGGAGGDAACFVGADSTHWVMYVNRGTWTKH